MTVIAFRRVIFTNLLPPQSRLYHQGAEDAGFHPPAAKEIAYNGSGDYDP
jgi:hypothetical protein